MRSVFSLITVALAGFVSAGTVVWDGRFNDLTSSADLEKWSWANQVGPYQYYIHGSKSVSSYVNLSPSYKNPADGSSNQGVKITIDPTALWNSDMWRTELIPQTKANLGTGTLYYHFSMKKSNTNPPNPSYEHQVNFFESHFTEMKYGWVNGNPTTAPDNNLRWFVGGQSKWNVDWVADVWHNFAYEINFSSNTVSLWHSSGGAALTKVAGPFSASTSTNSADWHLGVLRLPNRQGGTNDQAAEDWYYSGVYVESGSLTTSFTGGSSEPEVPVSSTTSTTRVPTTIPTTAPTTSIVPTTTPTTTVVVPTTTPITTTTTTTPVPTPTQTETPAGKYGQCGGNGWSGPTTCVSGSTCTKLNDWYYQCL